MVLKNEILKLHPEEVPKTFYNIAADLPVALAPPLNPATREPIGPSDLATLFPMELIRQEVSTERFIDIPETVRDIFARFRPTPIMRATRLEKMLKTDVKIFFKYEGVSPSGSHKTNTAIPQAYYNMKEGIEKLTTETGAGQWGTALSYATSFFDMSLDVFMVRVSYEGKPYRKTMMKLLNDRTSVFSSPSQHTEYGRNVASGNPEHSGSLGVAISEAIEAAISQGAKYSLGSVLNHVLIHQSIIGQEAKIQLRNADIVPDVIIGCVGGGSNFAGLAYPFLEDRIKGRSESKFIAVESSAAPKMTQGEIRYDFGDTGKTTPLLRMHTIGSDFIPPPIHAGGLRYHGLAPTLSTLIDQKLVKAEAYSQTEVFNAAKLFTQSEGIIPAPESAHAIASAIKEARIRDEGTILFNLSGHGLLDLAGYDEYLQGNLRDLSASADQIKASLSNVL